jgi:hypothetical protein
MNGMESPAQLRGFLFLRTRSGMTWRCLLLVLAGGLSSATAGAADSAIAPFSAGSPGAKLPAPWRISTLPSVKRATQYSLVADDATVVLRAVADASMASVMHPLKLDPKAAPFLTWRWKVSNILSKSDLSSKAGDDFPARVYVLFDYDTSKLSILQRAKIYLARSRYGKDVPAAALCYVWDGKAPVGTSVWSPYTDRVRVIVVESGSANLNRWREVQRDVVADFRAAFGEEPPAISGVAVASDTDNTGESVTALFGDIRLIARPLDAR